MFARWDSHHLTACQRIYCEFRIDHLVSCNVARWLSSGVITANDLVDARLVDRPDELASLDRLCIGSRQWRCAYSCLSEQTSQLETAKRLRSLGRTSASGRVYEGLEPKPYPQLIRQDKAWIVLKCSSTEVPSVNPRTGIKMRRSALTAKQSHPCTTFLAGD